jgi:quinol monooxygenase YgiN
MYLLHGSLSAKPGHAGELANLLITASQLVSTSPGCKLYAISQDAQQPDVVFVTEIWETKQDHANSLQQPGVIQLIQKAMPIIDKQPEKGQELSILGGFGIHKDRLG